MNTTAIDYNAIEAEIDEIFWRAPVTSTDPAVHAFANIAYDKRAIMKRAHSIRKSTKVSMSVALHKAWIATKLERVEEQKFMLNMKDQHDCLDDSQMTRLSNEARALRSQLAA